MSKAKQIVASLMGASMMLTGAGAAFASQGNATPEAADLPESLNGIQTAANNYQVTTSVLAQREAAGLQSVANVQGEFSFNQEGISPSDEMFNVFGTAILSMCSKPAAELEAEQQGEANFLINIGGHVQKNFTVDLSKMSDEEISQLMVCSCATGSPFGQTKVTGVPLRKVVEMSQLLPGTVSMTAFSADGYGEAIPLEYALERNALLVYKVNDQDLVSTAGSSVQMWMPETVAKYFTRNIATIEFSTDEAADPVGVDPTYRNKIKLLNDTDGIEFGIGDDITFEGVADDLGSPITAIEFSLDGGVTWTSCSTEGATADKWVNWKFTTSLDAAGDYELEVRALTADGVVSPLSASMSFTVA